MGLINLAELVGGFLKKTAQTIQESSGKIFITSTRKPNLIETDDGKEFVVCKQNLHCCVKKEK